jgi:hypothetical protein
MLAVSQVPSMPEENICIKSLTLSQYTITSCPTRFGGRERKWVNQAERLRGREKTINGRLVMVEP